MKIEQNLPPIGRNSSERVTGTKKGESDKNKNVIGNSSGKDNVVISEEAQLFSKAMMKVIDIPDTRQSLVQNIKTQIMDGNYKIHYEELASILSAKGIFD